MIKFLTLFFLLTSLNAQTTTYLLPDEYSLFEDELLHLSKNHQITILSPTINHAGFKKTLLKNISKGYPLTLITSTHLHDPSNLVAYRGVNLYLYQGRKLSGTWILIDNTYVCHISSSFDDAILTETAQTTFCSDDSSLIANTFKMIQTFQKRSQPYLK